MHTHINNHNMKTFRIIGLALVAILICLSACSGGGDDPIEPTPQPEVIKSEITIDSSILTNGLSFTSEKGEQSISFSTNESWTLSVASTTSGATWCTASATSGSKGSSSVKFSVVENTSYENRSVSVTIKSGTVTKTFTISQKCAEALLVTTDKYEIAQEGGTIDIEVKANIEYKMEISEEAKDWISESSGRVLTPYKHTLNIAMNEENKKREGEVIFKSGDKVETVKIYQAGGVIFLLSQNEFSVSDKGGSVSVDIQSNIEYGVQMPDVDWIIDEASSRGLSSHTLKYTIKVNEGYDSRSAKIIFYDENSEMKDTLKIIQAQKDAIIISMKEYDIKPEGEIIEVKLSTNVDFEIIMPEVDWITQMESRALNGHTLYFKVSENNGYGNRSTKILFTQKDSELKDSVIVNQQPQPKIVTLKEAGTLKQQLGNDYLKIVSLKVVGPINGSDVYYLRKMLGSESFSEADWGKLTTLDLSEVTIKEGGEWYYEHYSDHYYTSNNSLGDFMFYGCTNLRNILLPRSIISIGSGTFTNCSFLSSIDIPDNVTSIGSHAFSGCSSLASIDIPNNVTTIDHFAFSDCSSLTSINIPNGVTSIGYFLFSGCSSLTFIDIPNSVVEIYECAFKNCSSLTSIDIPDGVTSIGIQAFENCSSLTSIDIPDSVTSISYHAFRSCSSLTSITIGNGVTSIGYEAFYNCSSLATLTIGKSVTTMGNSAFDGCKSLKQCYSYATNPPAVLDIYNPPFPYYGDDTILYVPGRSGSKYKSSYWSRYFKNIVEMD